MAEVIETLLVGLIRSLVKGWVYALLVKTGAWLDTKISSRRARVIVGMLFGAAAFLLIPIMGSLLQ